MEKGDTILDREIENLTINACKASHLEKGLIISLWGAIDTYNSQQFHNIINDLVKKGYINIIFSCSNLNYVSSMGIGTFIDLLEKVKIDDGNIVFSEMQEKIMQVFNKLGFMTFFRFEENLEKALSSLS
jgi:anti-sigma B factor antagonist